MTHWFKAARLASQSYIALPLVLGQVHGWAVTGNWSWKTFFLIQLYGIFDQLYIVFANDFADRETDADNRTSTIFSGGSRVLVDGEIAPFQLRRAAQWCAAICVALSGLLAVTSIAIPGLVIFGVGLLWAYSYPPLKLSYRGGGELLQMIGVGAVLPLVGFAGQTGGFGQFPWGLLVVILPLQYACAVSTALPDEPSDRRADKRTLPVIAGSKVSRVTVCVINACAFAVYVLLFGPSVWLVVPAIGVVLMFATVRFAVPGTRGVSTFVFGSILVNLGILLTEVLRIVWK